MEASRAHQPVHITIQHSLLEAAQQTRLTLSFNGEVATIERSVRGPGTQSSSSNSCPSSSITDALNELTAAGLWTLDDYIPDPLEMLDGEVFEIEATRPDGIHVEVSLVHPDSAPNPSVRRTVQVIRKLLRMHHPSKGRKV